MKNSVLMSLVLALLLSMPGYTSAQNKADRNQGTAPAKAAAQEKEKTEDKKPASKKKPEAKKTAAAAAPKVVLPPIPQLGINLESYNYPYQVNLHTFESQNQTLQMAYMYRKPSKPNGRTVVLLHGKNFNGAYWQETMAFLLGKGYSVLVPDQIGFGKSAKPDHYQYSFQQLAMNTRNLLDTLKLEKVTVLGHSMGGMLAARFALMYPDNVEQLILVNPIGLEDWKLKVPYQPVEAWYQSELKQTPEKMRQYMLETYFDNKWKKQYDPLLSLQAGVLSSPGYPRLAWNSALIYDMIMTQPVLYEFPQIKVPTTLIIGQRDHTALGKNLVSKEVAATMGIYGELGRAANMRIPGSKIIELNDLGHMPHVENFSLFSQKLVQALANK